MWLVSFWSLRPLRLIGDEVRAIEDGKKQRFDSEYPSEIRPLTQNLNLLLQREEHQMTRYRNALDDLAHSRKTPLAVLSGLSEENTPLMDQRDTLKQQTERMNQIVSYQLQKAATVGGDLISKPVDLNVVLQKTVDGLAKVYQAKGVELNLETESNFYIRMDESDLYEVIGNLIDNACKYGKSRVDVSAKMQGRVILLSIEDDGDGLEAEQMATIMTRGTRLDQSKEGQGIGLAVVKEIVTAYELKVDLSRSALGGLKIDLELTNSR
jgi:two-component system sensor histidine kinase PhoQ